MIADDDSSPTPGYRRSTGSARGLARRDALLVAIVDDVATNGLGDVSLRRFATAAGTTHKVLLYHFDGVEDLLAQVLRELRSRRIAAAQVAASNATTLSQMVRDFWPSLAADDTGFRAIDQAIGLAMYDPARYAHLASEATEMYRVALRALSPADWPDDKRTEVVELIVATMRGFLMEWRTVGSAAEINAGLNALVRAIEREEGLSEPD